MAPTGMVLVNQADLTSFASEIQAVVAVLGPYIQQLVAKANLPAADESAITAAITALQGLEPPASQAPSSSSYAS